MKLYPMLFQDFVHTYPHHTNLNVKWSGQLYVSYLFTFYCTYVVSVSSRYVFFFHVNSEFLAPIIETEFTEDFSPDLICYSINLCYVEKKLCNLFPLPFPANDIRFHNKHDISLNETLFLKEKMVHSFPWICYLPGKYLHTSRDHFTLL